VVDCTETKDRSELSEASELGLVMSIILGVLTVVVTDAGGKTEVLALVVIGAGGNGKAVGLLDFDFEEILTEDILVASAEITEDGRENFESADSVLVLLDDARV